MTENDTSAAAKRPSEHAVLVPHDKLMKLELDRRTETVRQRDNVGRGEAHVRASASLQGQIKTDLLAGVERGLYRIWYSRSRDSGDFQEVAIWFEGTLYNWPVTSKRLCTLIQEGIDERCQSVGTFCRSDEQSEDKAPIREADTVGATASSNCIELGKDVTKPIAQTTGSGFASYAIV